MVAGCVHLYLSNRNKSPSRYLVHATKPFPVRLSLKIEIIKCV